jgi:uncharacterized protein (TIGR00369 family)
MTVSKSRSSTTEVASACVFGVKEDHCNLVGTMHGGAIMTLADQCGAMATGANLGPDQWTTTLESKTNFFAAISIGDVVTADSRPLHRGRTTMVWQTRVTRSDGKLAAIVTQTQMVISDSSASGR